MSRRARILLLIALGSTSGCRRDGPVPPAGGDSGATAAAGPPNLLASVVDPWTWPRGRGASDRDRAIEDIGPYEPLDRTQAGSPLGNPNAHYWTRLVGIAWDRDVALDFDDEPVDLDGDGAPDTRVTRHVHAKGGILANPDLFGLVRTPDDPRGRVGRISASTGVLGLREALDPDGRPTGMIGMTCFVCHGGVDPADGRVVLGLPGTAFDYGLLLATAAVLDDKNVQAVAARRARGFPDGRTVRARLLLAGPGRQDLTGEFGLDVTVPGTHSAYYPGTRRVRQGVSGIVNPISVPGILAAPGVDLQNWSGSEMASARWLRRLAQLGGRPTREILQMLGLPDADIHDPRASVAARRALLLDLRNLGTLGLQQDSFPGLLWADAIYGHATLQPRDLLAVPAMYSTAAIRRVLSSETVTPPRLAAVDAAAVARGREIFSNRIVGVIANHQILKESPRLYAAAKPGGAPGNPILAPIDEALPPTFSVRCADCHSSTPGGEARPLADNPPPLGRCGHCHRGHRPINPMPTPMPTPGAGAAPGAGAGAGAQAPAERVAWTALRVPQAAAAEIAFCTRCHQRHRPFTPIVYSSSLLLPFDANGNGKAQDDEGGDAAAGGIGTEALLAFDVPRPQRPPGGFAIDLPALSALHTLGSITTRRLGVSWVRVPPLTAVRATAPYLHNGSVPTLRALLEPARRRPAHFPLGAAGFVLDTRVPGNRNMGHEFGTALRPHEKADLVAFLESL